MEFKLLTVKTNIKSNSNNVGIFYSFFIHIAMVIMDRPLKYILQRIDKKKIFCSKNIFIPFKKTDFTKNNYIIKTSKSNFK